LISISNHRSIYQSFNYIHDYFVSCIMHWNNCSSTMFSQE
jgi:hypothetical protein